MKKYILVLTIFLLTLTAGQGQTNVYHSFPDSAIWRVDYYCHNTLQYIINANYYFQYSITGDTLINSNIYKKIYRSFVFEANVYHNTPISPPPPPPSGYVGALRDNPVSNKTFFIFANTSDDSLLYDYNLGVGDTLRGFITLMFDTFHIKPLVSSIDSILINGQYRKRWNFDSINDIPLYIIEGIGTSNGLIEQIYTSPMDFTNRYLVCVKDDSNVLFVSNYYSSVGCNLIYEGLDEINSDYSFNCYPNPFSSQMTLQTNNVFKKATLTVYNSFGQQVKQIKNVSGQSFTLQRDNLSSGLYFLQLTQDNKILTTDKIVITDK